MSSRWKLSRIKFTNARELARHVVGIIRTENNSTRKKEWRELERVGRVLRLDSLDEQASFVWLQAGKLSSIVARNVIAVQEGCLLTRAHPSCINAEHVVSYSSQSNTSWRDVQNGLRHSTSITMTL